MLNPSMIYICDRCGELIDTSASCWGVCDCCRDELCDKCAESWDEFGYCKDCSDIFEKEHPHKKI